MKGEFPSWRECVLLGLLQGPAELLPISSSGHLELAPWLLGADPARHSPEARKTLGVALHAGTSLGSIAGGSGARANWNGRRLRLHLLALLVPSACGLLLEDVIERRLSGPRQIAMGLLVGSAAMTVAERRPGLRRAREAGARDGAWLGAAQALALLPGISRSGAVLAMARALGFGRRDAARLASELGSPVSGAAGALRLARLARSGVAPAQAGALAAGATAAAVSTRLSRPALKRCVAGGRLLPFAAYRTALAIVVLRRLRSGARATIGR